MGARQGRVPPSIEAFRPSTFRLTRVVVLVALSLGALSCRRAQPIIKPVASLADTTSASRAFDRIRTLWQRSDPGERAAFRQELDAFIRSYPTDGLAPLARVYAVLSLMESPADWADAEHRLDNLPLPQAGSTQDLYVIAIAKLRRYHHQPEVAFELLRPLVGTVVGSRARSLLQEELTFDSLESRQPYEAIAYMDAWLRGASEEDRQASESKVAVALGAVPEAALRASLKSMRSGRKGGGGGPSHGYGEVIERLVGERLGQIAVERGDAALARWLLDTNEGEPLLGEDALGTLGQLATSRRGIGTVAGRTVGLVLPTSSVALRDEVADVLRGVLWALDIGHDSVGASPAATGDRIRLVTRDDGGDAGRLRSAMEEVAGEGASVIITALDPDAAAEAFDWVRKSGLNVIVLASPPASASGAPGASAGVSDVASAFSVGEDWPAELRVLAQVVGDWSGAPPGTPRAIATLGDSEAMSSIDAAARAQPGLWQAPVSCELAPTRAGESRFPLGAWAQAGIHRWVVAGSAECAADLLVGLKASARGVVGLSLEASETVERARAGGGLRIVSATAGIVPLALAEEGDPRVMDAQAMAKRSGAPEGWWAAVGHDAAALARKAVATLPSDTVADADEIARRRAAVRKGLVEAKVPLWTSEHEGFDEARTLPRSIRAVELPSRAP